MTEIINQNINLILISTFALIAGILDAFTSRLSSDEAFSTSIFLKWKRNYWLRTSSWTRRYKSYDTGTLIVSKFDKKNRPIYKPKFRFLGLRSDKSLLFLTDGWHFLQFLKWSFIALALATGSGHNWNQWEFWALWFGLRLLMSGTFRLFFNRIFRSRG